MRACCSARGPAKSGAARQRLRAPAAALQGCGRTMARSGAACCACARTAEAAVVAAAGAGRAGAEAGVGRA